MSSKILIREEPVKQVVKLVVKLGAKLVAKLVAKPVFITSIRKRYSLRDLAATEVFAGGRESHGLQS